MKKDITKVVAVGIDVEDKTSQVCTKDATGAVVWEKKVRTTEAWLSGDTILKSRRTPMAMAYTQAGALSALTFNNGFAQRVDYDAYNRPKGFQFERNAAPIWRNGSYVSTSTPYQYDGAGNITSIGAAPAPGNRVDTFAYDLLSRLATASVNGGGYTHNYAYQYDAFGNLTSRVVSAPGAASLLAALSDSAKYASAALVPDGVAITSYIKNVVFQASLALDPVTGVTNNRLVSVSRGGTIQGVATGVLPQTASMVYDANGNLVDDGQFVYAYDPLNRQTAVWTRDATKPPNYKGALLSQAFYDAAGERAAGVTYDAAGIAKDFTAYLRDGAAVLWERTVTRDNAYPRKDKSYLYAAGRMAYARTRALSAFTGRSYIQMVGGAGGARLGAPVFSFDDDGQEAKAFYAVSGLTPDVAAFEIAVRALNPPPGQHDDETTQRFAKPAEGWPGGFQVLFKGLIPGISYGVTFTVETTLGTVPILGPRRVVLENGSFTAPLAPSAPCAWASRHWELNRGGAEDAEEELAVGWDHLENGGQGSYIVSMRVNGNETVLTPGPVSGNLVTMPVRTLPLPPGAAAGILAVTPLAGGGVALTAVPGGITPNVPYPPSTVTIHEYYATDHLGTVRAVYAIRPESPPQLQTFDYEPFGVELPSGASNTCDNTHRFTGHERDIATTGNDYMHFRYYGSNMGRFMKPDNISGNMGNPQSWNLYSYVVGNPVNFNDPTGHMVGIAWRSYYSAGGPGPCAGGGNHWFANEWGGGIGLGEHPWDSNPSGGSYSNFNITPVKPAQGGGQAVAPSGPVVGDCADPQTTGDAEQTGGWLSVKATREGLIGQTTATGHVIGAEDYFVALPSRTALNCLVEVNYRDSTLTVPVLDVGPWNVRDAYWMTNSRPQAETGVDLFGRSTNGAGIDLSNAVFYGLGLTDNTLIRWRFAP